MDTGWEQKRVGVLDTAAVTDAALYSAVVEVSPCFFEQGAVSLRALRHALQLRLGTDLYHTRSDIKRFAEQFFPAADGWYGIMKLPGRKLAQLRDPYIGGQEPCSNSAIGDSFA